MEFKEELKEKIYYEDIPKQINKRFDNIFRYNKPLKILNISKNIECDLIIKNIICMYYLDDIFYINSKLHLLIIWEDVKKWKIINRV